MKGFELSTNSWHYKLYKENWRNPREPENFCDYFWAVVRSLAAYTIMIAFLAFIIGGFCVATYQRPFEMLLLVSLFTLVASCVAKISEFKENRRRKLYEEGRRGSTKGPGFFKLKWESLRNNYCPKITWVKE